MCLSLLFLISPYCYLTLLLAIRKVKGGKTNLIYKVIPGQVSYGEAIGIILLEGSCPAIPGDVANASTYSFPVRFQRAKGLTPERVLSKDLTLLDSVIEAGAELVKEGVKAVTSDCGFMALFQKELAVDLGYQCFCRVFSKCLLFLGRSVTGKS